MTQGSLRQFSFALQGQTYHPQRRFIGISQQIDSMHTMNMNAPLPKPCVPNGVLGALFGAGMDFPIHLDAQTRLGTIEVENIGTERMLVAEHEPFLAAGAQAQPEPEFGLGQGFSQASCDSGFSVIADGPPPTAAVRRSPWLCESYTFAAPNPVNGEGEDNMFFVFWRGR